MVPPKKKPTPVFIFLDENIAGLDEEIARAFLKWYSTENFTPHIFSFPKSKKGKKDWEVVLYLKQAVFSPRYPIRALLDDGLAPVVVFLTLDLDFVEDAQWGFNKLDKQWRLHEQAIELNKGRVIFKEGERAVAVPILTVAYTEKDHRWGLSRVLARALSRFLSK